MAERYRTDLLSQGWGNTQVGSLSADRQGFLHSPLRLLISEFDNEEKVISQYLSQTKWCFGRMDICTGVKSQTSWFNSTGHPHTGLM